MTSASIAYRIVAGALWVAVATMGANATWHWVGRAGAAQRPPVKRDTQRGIQARFPGPVQPFTVVLRESVIASDGHTKPGAVYTFAQRSNGDYVSHTEFVVAKSQSRQREIRLSTGLRIDTDDLNALKSTIMDPAERRDPATQCVNTFSGAPYLPGAQLVGTEVLSGYQTVKIQRAQSTLWLAPSLGCAPLREFVKYTDVERSSKTVDVIQAGDPQHDLFEVDKHYREVPFSTLFRLRDPKTAARYDKTYYELHPVDK